MTRVPAAILGQLTFDDPPTQRHSATSRAAAEQIKEHAPSIRQRVYDLIAYAGPISDQQIAVTLGLAENTVRPRRRDLQKEGIVRACGITLTASGRKAVAWGVDQRHEAAPQGTVGQDR